MSHRVFREKESWRIGWLRNLIIIHTTPPIGPYIFSQTLSIKLWLALNPVKTEHRASKSDYYAHNASAAMIDNTSVTHDSIEQYNLREAPQTMRPYALELINSRVTSGVDRMPWSQVKKGI